jgi:hypothetical protein
MDFLSSNPYVQTTTPQSGICGVCGHSVLLHFKCRITGIIFGKCCEGAMRSADSLLQFGVNTGSIRHPHLGELTSDSGF